MDKIERGERNKKDRERERKREKEKERENQFGESHRSMGRQTYHVIVMSSELQEVANFVSTLTVLTKITFASNSQNKNGSVETMH